MGLECEGVFGSDAEVQLKAIQTSVNFRNWRFFQWCRQIFKNREKFYYLNSYGIRQIKENLSRCSD